MVDIFSGSISAVLQSIALAVSPLRPLFDVIYAVSKVSYDVTFVLAVCLSAFLLTLIVFVHLFKKSTKEVAAAAKELPTVTIQIPTRNELVAIECAQRCLAFDYPKNKFDILIGDDSDKPEVSAKLVAFASKYPGRIQIIRRTTNAGFKPGNLNNMLPHTKGDIIVIFDSDFAPEKDFLKRIVAPFVHDEEVSAVQAKWDFNNYDQNLTTRIAALLVYLFQDVSMRFSLIFGLGYLCGSAEAVRKDDLLALGGWKSGCLTEDIEYSLRLHVAGKKIMFLDKLSCFNQVPQYPRDLYKQQMRWAHGIITAYMANFKGILFTSGQSTGRKVVILYNAFAYIFSIVFMLMFVFGIISIVTHAPTPFNTVQFISDLSFDVAMTSGFLICCFYILFVEKKLTQIPYTIAGTFTVAVPVNFFINIGVFKALTKRPMPWYLLSKKVK